MSSLLKAADVSPNKIEVTDKLPTKVGDVSIMTLEQAFISLLNSNRYNDNNVRYDPSFDYSTSKYYMYGIVGSDGINSTIESLGAVGLDWYKQYNKPTTSSQTFTSNGKLIFGGPLYGVHYIGSSDMIYDFSWYYNDSHYNSNSVCSGYWDSQVSSSTYVAVVRARE